MNMGGVVAVHLPCPEPCPLLIGMVPEYCGRVFSVRIDGSGASVDQLRQLLSKQKPDILVLSSSVPLGANDVQRLTDLAFRTCANVSVVGTFASTPWKETITVRISGVVRSFCLLDGTVYGSIHGNHIIVYGAVEQLDLLTVNADCHAHVTGAMRADANTSIRARTLTINGMEVPVMSQQPAGATDQTYMFMSVQPQQPTSTVLGYPKLPQFQLPLPQLVH